MLWSRTPKASTATPTVQWCGEGVHLRLHEVVTWKDLLGRLLKACTILESTIVVLLLILIAVLLLRWLVLLVATTLVTSIDLHAR